MTMVMVVVGGGIVAATAIHRDATRSIYVCMYISLCVCGEGENPVTRTIGHLCGRTENDRNSNHYSRSKKETSHRPTETSLRPPVAVNFPLRVLAVQS